jgi:hypothetical protein
MSDQAKTLLSLVAVVFVLANVIYHVHKATAGEPKSPFVAPTATTDMLGRPRAVTAPDYVPADPCDTDPSLDGCEFATP